VKGRFDGGQRHLEVNLCLCHLGIIFQSVTFSSLRDDNQSVKHFLGQEWTMTDTDSYRLLLRPTEAADRLGISRSRIYELIAQGVIPSIRIGNTLRVPAEALRRWVEGQLAESSHDRSGAADVTPH
jgi:excisionase family DNA binding protein